MCKQCDNHNREMQRVWRGLTRLYRARLAELRPWISRDPKRRAEYRKTVDAVNRLVAKMGEPRPERCNWRHAQ